MKKFFLIAALAAVAASANAQDKTEVYYGSQQGGFAISLNADPVLNYIGNMFNGKTNNSFGELKGIGIGNDVFSGVTISGKYFLKDNMAIRADLGFNNTGVKTYQYETDPSKENYQEYTEKGTVNTRNFTIAAGVDWTLRPGKRLQPILGIGIVYMHHNLQNGTSLLIGTKEESWTGSPQNLIGLDGRVGVEFFCTKQFSLAAVMDITVAKTWKSKSITYHNLPDSKEFNYVEKGDYLLKTGQAGAHIAMNFYF